MLTKTKKGFFTLTTFSKLPVSLVISTLKQGDMRKKSDDRLTKFVQKLGVEHFVRAEQTHGNLVTLVGKQESGKTVDLADALITKEMGLGLSVVTADCLPIVLYDPQKKVLGIAHAGWKGSLNGVVANLVSSALKVGSKAENILVGFGPCIEFCHYEIGKEVADEFRKAGYAKSVLTSVSGKLYLDLKQVNIQQLEKAGVRKQNIDVTVKTCTFESKEFYSFRRDKSQGKELSGEFVTIVSQKES